LFRGQQLAVQLHRLFPKRRNSYSDNLSANPSTTTGPARRVTMNTTRSIFTLITAVTAIVALTAGMLLALSAPAPGVEDFGRAAVQVASSSDEA
jgi:hypothetical protein